MMDLDMHKAAELYETAERISDNAYAPYSGFRVGAALLAGNGRVYTGVNIENSSFGATICAERTAFVKAVSEGERDFTAIAITSSGKDLTFPCGICRQVLSEFSPEIKVILEDEKGELHTFALSELLPHSFTL